MGSRFPWEPRFPVWPPLLYTNYLPTNPSSSHPAYLLVDTRRSDWPTILPPELSFTLGRIMLISYSF
ncbi:hypothetical protein M8J77_026197 [Diaphorina citri]|nr:hypothetical protein M8J77_026197 [Diaphorina citri]